MSYYVESVKAGLREFLEEQQDNDDTICTISVYEFNGSAEKTVDAIHIKDLDLSFVDNYTPRGATRLRDTILKAVTETEQLFSSPIKPDKIQFMIVTDGADTVSDESADKVKEIIEQKTDEGWVFTYQGQGRLAYNQSNELGFSAQNAVQYSGQKSPDLWKMSSKKMSNHRSALAAGSFDADEAMAYTDKERKELE